MYCNFLNYKINKLVGSSIKRDVELKWWRVDETNDLAIKLAPINKI